MVYQKIETPTKTRNRIPKPQPTHITAQCYMLIRPIQYLQRENLNILMK